MVELAGPKSPVKEGINNMIFILPMIIVITLAGWFILNCYVSLHLYYIFNQTQIYFL